MALIDVTASDGIVLRLVKLAVVAFIVSIAGLTTCTLVWTVWPRSERLYPACQNREAFFKRAEHPVDYLTDSLAAEFLTYFQQRLPSTVTTPPPRRDYFYKQRRGPPGRIELVKLTQAAVRDVIVHRYGEDVERAITLGVVHLPEAEFGGTDLFPTCAALDKIARKGAEWSMGGPPLIYAK